MHPDDCDDGGGARMHLNESAEDRALRCQEREWLAEHLPREPLDSMEAKKAWHRQLYDACYVAMGWPKEYGGFDRRPMEQAIVAEEMARLNAPGGVNYMGISVCGPAIL